jgi:hypothetical protein
MTNHHGFNRAWACRLAVLVAVASLGCGRVGQPPSAPSSQLRLTSVQPSSGPAGAATPITITGNAFEFGTVLTIDGVETAATYVTRSTLTAIAPAHDSGPVNLIVRNPDGRTSGMNGGFRYVAPPVLTVTSAWTSAGSTAGGTFVLLSGTNFQRGIVAMIDGIAQQTYSGSSTLASLNTTAHAPGRVELVVMNPDGTTAQLSGGYTYALPQSFDFNGNWNAYIDLEIPSFRFAVQGNVLTSLTCGTASPILFSPPITVSNGEFSYTGAAGSLSGRILAAAQATGTIDFPACAAATWFAEK